MNANNLLFGIPIMTTGKRSKLIGSAALAALVIHPLATTVHAGVAVSIGQNFTGSTDSLAFFPRAAGAVSEDYFVEFNQDYFVIYNKHDGSLAKSLGWGDFWRNAGVPASKVSQHYVIYDPTVKRWFVQAGVAQSSNLNDHWFQIAMSETADPAGAWHGVSISNEPGGTNYSSGVTFGLDGQGVYASAMAWSPTNSNTSIGSTLLSLPKADLLLIPPVITNRTWFAFLDGANHGYSLQPAVCLDGSASGQVLATGGTGVDPSGNNATNDTLVAFAVLDPGSPRATLGGSQVLTVPAYTEPNNALQPDGSTDLVDWDASFTSHARCVGGVLYATHTIQLGARAAIRWYRVSAANHALLESGTITDPSLDLYYPSIAANTNGTVVLAFNGSGSNTFVSCFAVVGQTSNGVTTFGNLLLLQAGAASYQNPDPNGDDNWGTYSTTCVDPSDPNVFWTINTYAAATTTWATQITQLLTSPSPQLTIANTGTNLLLSWPVTTVPFALQSASGLAANAPWSSAGSVTVTNGNTVSTTLPISQTGEFFRLVASP
jgi:hypothetical protein